MVVKSRMVVTCSNRTSHCPKTSMPPHSTTLSSDPTPCFSRDGTPTSSLHASKSTASPLSLANFHSAPAALSLVTPWKTRTLLTSEELDQNGRVLQG